MSFRKQLSVFKDNWLVILVLLLVLLFVNGFVNNDASAVFSQKNSYEGAFVSDSFRAGGLPSQDFAPDAEERIKSLTVSMSLKVKNGEFGDAESSMKQVVSSADGFVLNENVNLLGSGRFSYHRGYYSLRIPADELDVTLERLKAIGEVTSFSTNSQDITASYLNLEDELSLAKDKLASYQNLLQEHSDLGDQITLLDKISYQESRIKSLEKMIADQDLRVDYAVVSLTLNEEVSDYAGINWLKFSDLIKSLVDSVKSLLKLFFVILPWALVSWIVWSVFVLVRKKK